MTRSHFADYAKRNPREYQTFSNNMHNAFVSMTHLIGLSKFFSFVPDSIPAEKRAGSEETPLKTISIHKSLYK